MARAKRSTASRYLRRVAAGQAARVVGGLSRRLRLGGGSTIGGRVGLVIDPGLLGHAGRGRTIALVTGTNGKTTTTCLLAAALRVVSGDEAITGVATSEAGANMPAGIVSALLSSPLAPFAALEVDEGYLGEVMTALSPRVIVLLNLSRDQLDRVSEVRQIATRWRTLLETSSATVIANADDPLVVWAASTAADVRYVAAGVLWRGDAYHCPACGARLDFSAVPGAGWACPCGLRRPDVTLALSGPALVRGDDRRVVLDLALPGRFNRANAALAAAAAEVLGVSLEGAVAAMAAVHEVGGRFASVTVGATSVRLLLAKNPAGWEELLELLGAGSGPVILAINARQADGQDPSWLWDVAFERLGTRHVVASGERRRDLAVRLRHAGIDHEVAADPVAWLDRFARSEPRHGHVDFVGNYTAFQDVRRRLGQKIQPSPSQDRGRAEGRRHLVAPETPPEGVPATTAPLRRTRRPAPTSDLSVVVVHPDLLGTYGDGGNGLVLSNRAAWRGLSVELILAPSDQPLPESADVYCLGGGEDGPQARSADVLRTGGLRRAIERGAVVLAVCAGYQILGHSFPGRDGRQRPGLGILDVDTEQTSAPRAVGELLVAPGSELTGLVQAPDRNVVTPSPGAPEQTPLALLTGFENHANRTRLQKGAIPLGGVLGGTGNDGASDGVVTGRVIGTYLHGPVLARNPQLADVLLGLVTGVALAPIADAEEDALRAERLGAHSAHPGHRTRVT